MNNILFSVLLGVALIAASSAKSDCPTGKRSSSKLVCYYGDLGLNNACYCTHIVLPASFDVKSIEKARSSIKGAKIYISVNEFNQGLINLLKDAKVDGLEINLKKLDSKNDITDFISTVKTKIGSDLGIVLAVPAKGDLVAKYFDFKALSKYAELFVLQTNFLGASTNVTFHPSRLSGMWDMQNTDSVVDLVSGLGAPLSKLVITAPVQAFKFKLQNEEYTAPGSPALEVSSITREELCRFLQREKHWTLERDEDQAGPYIFSKNQWIAFEDSKSMDIKAKYARIRGLAGLALKDLGQDGGVKCGYTILEAAYNGLSRQARAPRGAVLHSLEREILENPTKSLDSVELSPYKISRIIDTEGKIHIVRQDSRTEFQCSRQGYFVHPRSCNRFYRCVKFNQHKEEYNVFEFDCPAGLAFDERVEVCVWPGSLPHGTPCSGSSEIAPVPKERFECPSEPGYYADPENCRWFFACLDHGKSPLSAYEFRCPFGLVFDGDRLVCEWPWLVPKCAGAYGVGIDSVYGYGTTGYSGKVSGVVPAGLLLQNYDGLGALGTVKLGGLSGHIEKPISTVYSNVDGSILGSGYKNDGGYIIGNGLGYNAIKSLQNAGLLKLNNGAAYQFGGQNAQTSAYDHGNSGNIHLTGNVDSHNAGAYGTYSQTGAAGYNGATGQYYAGSGATGAGHFGNAGAVSSQSFTQYHGGAGQDGHANADLYKVSSADGTYSGNGGFAISQDFGGKPQGAGGYSSTGTGGATYSQSGHSQDLLSQDLHGQLQYQTQDGHSGVTANGGDYLLNGKLDTGFVKVADGAIGTGYVAVGVTDADKDSKLGSYSYNNQYHGNSAQQNSAGFVAVGDDQGASLNFGQKNIGAGQHNDGSAGFVGVEVDQNAGLNFGRKNIGAGQILTQTDHSGIYGGAGKQIDGSARFVAVGVDQNAGLTFGQKNIGAGQILTQTDHSGIYGGAGQYKDGSAGFVSVGVDQSSGLKHAGEGQILTETDHSGLYINAGQQAGDSVGHVAVGIGQNSDLNLEQKNIGLGQVFTQTDHSGVYSGAGQDNSAGYAVVGVAAGHDSGLNLAHKTNGVVTHVSYDNGLGHQDNSAGYTTVGITGNSDLNLAHKINGIVSQVTHSGSYDNALDHQDNSAGYVAVGVTGADQDSKSYSNVVQYQKNGQAHGQLNSARYVTAGAINNHISGLGEKTVTQFENQPGIVGFEAKDNLNGNAQYTFGAKYASDGTAGVKYSPASGDGGVSSQSFVQYHGNEGGKIITSSKSAGINQYRGNVKYNSGSGIAGNVNIVGGGYSAVGSVSGIHVTNNGEVDDVKTVSYSSTPSPVSVTTFASGPALSSIPAVTSVPVPGIKTSVGFETFKGGVIANVPELQYKVQSHSDLGLLNISSGFANVVVTTPGYQQDHTSRGGYVYNKPLNNIQISTARPFVALSTEEPKVYISSTVKPARIVENYVKDDVSYSTYKPILNINGAVSSSSFQKYDTNRGFKYNTPSVATYTTVSTPRPTVTVQEQPQVYVSSTPAAPTVSSYSFTQGAEQINLNKGYLYNKPAVAFEGAPSGPSVISKFSIRNPEANSGAYYYESEHGREHNVLETYAQQQPAIVSQYHYQQPAIVQPVQPVVPLVKQPQLLSTYTYQQPAYKQQTSYNFKDIALEAVGVSQTPRPNVSYQPGGGTSYQYFKFDNNAEQQNVNVQNEGYVYQKPIVVKEQPQVIVSSTARPHVVLEHQRVRYNYPKPAIKFEETPIAPTQPAVVTSYFNIDTKPQVVAQEENVGYSYPKPEIKFETPSQPAQVTSYFNIESKPQVHVSQEENVEYGYVKPDIKFQVPSQPAQVTSYFNIQTKPQAPRVEKVGYKYPKPEIKFEEIPIISTTSKPLRPAVTPSYFSISSSTEKPSVILEQENIGYRYPKPAVKFEETPITYSTPKPIAVVQPSPQPAVVSSYFNIGSQTPAPEVYVKEQNVGYTYDQPSIKFEGTPVTYSTPKPAVVSYNFISSTTPQPNIVVEEKEQVQYKLVSSTPQPVTVEEHKPAVVTSYFNIKQSERAKGYHYPKPAVAFEEGPQIINYNDQEIHEEPFVQKTAYVTGRYDQNEEAHYQQSGQYTLEGHEFPELERVKQVVFGEKIQYKQPNVAIQYVQSTPKPTFVTTVQAIAAKNIQPVTPATVTVYDSRFSSTPESYISSTLAPEVNIISSTARPISKYSFSANDDGYMYNGYIDLAKSTTPQPGRTYLPVTSTVRVTSALPRFTKTKVVEAYVAPEVTTAGKVYLPAQTPTVDYLATKTYSPVRQRVRITSTTATPIVTPIVSVPVRQRVKVTTAAPFESTKLYNPVTIIKQNDAHPLLSAKLGAQCTCVSNTLKLRKNQKIIIVEDDSVDDEDDGYLVDDTGLGKVIKTSYSSTPENIVEITPTPEVYVAGSTLAPKGYGIRKRVKVRPYNPVTELSEIFLKKDVALTDDYVSDGEIAKAVRTSLKLVKQAAKEGAIEGTQEALTKPFDRYGPGGVRSRDETLQGTIDCQRAGLFRHPTECNKFYACRWDCTKNRFTLHVFNCPVHLTFDNSLGACNWPSQGPACVANTLITSD
ncbi:hypothetical protein GWI33_015040 [Rhynchophorus ferrugineus]|uniref:Chitinase n=1 Tax=Rhynchophorus ferrugineus TaxID=354439 RepID=A0A834I1E3_RHYFE|nr:hypothetical protein GWI33_015040 [Rhynchophorus ferrugineus]